MKWLSSVRVKKCFSENINQGQQNVKKEEEEERKGHKNTLGKFWMLWSAVEEEEASASICRTGTKNDINETGITFKRLKISY
jgi:hypothetical protein